MLLRRAGKQTKWIITEKAITITDAVFFTPQIGDMKKVLLLIADSSGYVELYPKLYLKRRRFFQQNTFTFTDLQHQL